MQTADTVDHDNPPANIRPVRSTAKMADGAYCDVGTRGEVKREPRRSLTPQIKAASQSTLMATANRMAEVINAGGDQKQVLRRSIPCSFLRPSIFGTILFRQSVISLPHPPTRADACPVRYDGVSGNLS